ncbi:MAG: chromosomal replication initiator protein DnaA [bacterium]
MTTEEVWQTALAQIQLTVSPANFSTWFKNTEVFSIEDGQAVIRVPNSFVKEWLENKYNKVVFKALRDLDDRIRDVSYVIGQSNNAKAPKKELAVQRSAQPELEGLKVDKETNLNPRYTFKNFVVGPFNELPHAAAFAVTVNPGSAYNPLFIYGGVGLGKTHLLQAIGNEVLVNFPGKIIKYIPSERFTTEVVSAIKNRTMDILKNKYRRVDVLIIDDIQFLAGKEKTQEEFFHVFNSLYERNCQVVISSDRPPKAIPALTERLRSRFEGGMIADVSCPDFETRMAILKTKAQEKNISLPDEALSYIATNIQRNIRELEGALNRLIAHQNLNNRSIDFETTREVLKKLLFSPAKATTPQKIIQTVAGFYDLKEKDLLVSSRKKEVVRPRQVAMFLLREDLKGSYPFIGRKFGGKDHTTVIHSCNKIRRELEDSENLKGEIELIRQLIFSA